ELVVRSLSDLGVDIVFGYPGGAVLPIYDVIFSQEKLRHILVRHEQGAVHAAEGYARSTGKVGVVLVTSGPGATNAVTGLTDALMDSIPLVCFTGQVATHLIGNDAFQEADTTGITRPCTKHNYLVKDINNLNSIIHEAFYVAKSGRPGPVVIDLPKDIQLQNVTYQPQTPPIQTSYNPKTEGDREAIESAAKLISESKRPVFYTGGGVINSGQIASDLLIDLVRYSGFPITSTLMGLGAYPGTDSQFLGMLGMHGTYEANMAMHQADLLIAVGSRFDDRITGRLDAFSPNSKKIHIDIDPSSINKNVPVDVPIIGDIAKVLDPLAKTLKNSYKIDSDSIKKWWSQINDWKKVDCLHYQQDKGAIKPQFAIETLYNLTKNMDARITTEVGQHQMWAAQFYQFDKPNRWMTSGGLGTMGYGLPAAIGVQLACPESLVVDIAGEASILMNIQEISTAVQYRLPVKIFILNNGYMGMVRQWQELLHGGRYSESYTEALPDFVKLAESFHAFGLRVEDPNLLESSIEKMIDYDGPVILDVVVDPDENCFPMIPSGSAHNEMMLGKGKGSPKLSKEGLALV
ncbi:MAG: acetolactate synthase 3 large subunit, partial [Rhodospirillaceae bacterium]|nr:acetolactate synthase 3 large subunit [Rhodospirillaceae bacterium]